MKSTLLLLLAAAVPAFAANPPKPQIEISARFTEIEMKTGKTELLSAPRITTKDGCRARIELVDEFILEVPGAAIPEARLPVSKGISLDMTPWIDGDHVILSGTAEVRELDGEVKTGADGKWAHLRVDTVPFSLRLKNGEPRNLPLSSSVKPGRKLTIQIAATKRVPVNASAIYWRAFAALPKLDDVERKLLDAKSSDPGAAERALAGKADAALKLLAEASNADFCDWSLDLTKGPALQLPHLAPMRDLAKLALLQARFDEPAEAVRRHVAVLRMARHVGTTPLLICRLVDLSIEALAIDSAAALLPRLDATQRDMIGSTFAYLEAVPSISDGVAAEGRNLSAWLAAELDAALKKSGASFDARAWLREVLAPAGTDTAAALEQLDRQGAVWAKDEAAVRQMIEGYRSQMEELARIIGLPHEKMKKEVPAFEQKLKAAGEKNVFVTLLAPAVWRARESELKGELRLVLLRVAVEVQAKGETALPADRAAYRKTDGGFELTSTAQFDGKPVVLRVGR